MKVSFLFAWYDIWVGIFWDKKKRCLYLLPLPMVGVKIDFNDARERKQFKKQLKGCPACPHCKSADRVSLIEDIPGLEKPEFLTKFMPNALWYCKRCNGYTDGKELRWSEHSMYWDGFEV